MKFVVLAFKFYNSKAIDFLHRFGYVSGFSVRSFILWIGGSQNVAFMSVLGSLGGNSNKQKRRFDWTFFIFIQKKNILSCFNLYLNNFVFWKWFDPVKLISKTGLCININNLSLLLGKDAGALLLYGGFDNDSNALGDCWKLDLDKGKLNN